MKKLTFIVMLLIAIVLTGCTGGSQVTAVIDKPAPTINETLKLDSVKNGVSINSSIDTTKDYIDVKVGSDVTSTLFYDVINLDSYLDKSFAGVNVKSLVFSTQTSAYVPSVVTELNNKNYGVTADSLGMAFTSSEGSKSLLGKLADSTLAKLPADYDVEKENVLVIIYLPVYCVYNSNGQDIVKSFVLVPVYYNYTYVVDSNVEDTNILGMTNFKISLNENGLLPTTES